MMHSSSPCSNLDMDSPCLGHSSRVVPLAARAKSSVKLQNQTVSTPTFGTSEVSTTSSFAFSCTLPSKTAKTIRTARPATPVTLLSADLESNLHLKSSSRSNSPNFEKLSCRPMTRAKDSGIALNDEDEAMGDTSPLQWARQHRSGSDPLNLQLEDDSDCEANPTDVMASPLGKTFLSLSSSPALDSNTPCPSKNRCTQRQVSLVIPALPEDEVLSPPHRSSPTDDNKSPSSVAAAAISARRTPFFRTQSESSLTRKRSFASLTSPINVPILAPRGLAAQTLDESFHSNPMVISPQMPARRPLKRTRTMHHFAVDTGSLPTASKLRPPPLVKCASMSAFPISSNQPLNSISKSTASMQHKHLLPSKPGTSDSIPRISPEVLLRLINGEFAEVERYHVIDCRFPFEYEGGHIPTARNVNCFEQLDAMFLTNTASTPIDMYARVPIIFHCEFSSHRAPAMAMHLRAQDRILNMNRYPEVLYPEIYILEGGYKAFWQAQPEHCVPSGAYMPMDHQDFRDQCRRETAARKLSLERSRSASTSGIRRGGAKGTSTAVDVKTPAMFKCRSLLALSISASSPGSPSSPSSGAACHRLGEPSTAATPSSTMLVDSDH